MFFPGLIIIIYDKGKKRQIIANYKITVVMQSLLVNGYTTEEKGGEGRKDIQKNFPDNIKFIAI